MKQINDIKTVFMDMDGVLVDIISPLTKLTQEQSYYFNYDYAKQFPFGKWRILKEDVFTKLNMEFWRDAPFTPDGLDILEYFENMYGSENIYILSQPTGYDGCLEGKYNWIKKNIPDYRKRFLLGKPKWVVANDKSLLVDDCDRFVNNWIDNDGFGILVPRLWNSKYTKVKSLIEHKRNNAFNFEIKWKETEII
ncbi:MAG: hypothetical protein M0R03_22555 [Novosphingobium sp.]|nr:hypothetical protein [Novosphingobium sp.]